MANGYEKNGPSCCEMVMMWHVRCGVSFRESKCLVSMNYIVILD